MADPVSASVIVGAGLSAAGAGAGFMASRSQARASVLGGQMEQAAARTAASNELAAATSGGDALIRVAQTTADKVKEAADKTADSQELAANLEREAADRVYAAQQLSYDYAMHAASDTRDIAEAQRLLGDLEVQAHEFRAGQLEEGGQLEQASASRAAIDSERQGKLADSTIVARAAASGGGVGDASVMHIRERLAGRTEEVALTQMFNGERANHEAKLAALSERLTGNAKLFESTGQYAGTLAKADGMARDAMGQLALAQAGLTVADAQKIKELAGAEAIRTSGDTEAYKITSGATLDAQRMKSTAGLDASRLNTSGDIAAYKGKAGGTIAEQQGYASLFSQLGSSASAFSRYRDYGAKTTGAGA